MNRSKSGKIRQKRADTKMGTIEKQYGVNFGTRSDMQLGNYLKSKGYSSLSSALKRSRKK